MDETIRTRIASLQEKWRRCSASVKWVEPENLHITLKFLGSTPSGRVGEICEVLRICASRRRSFRLGLEKLGAFPGISNARVIWVGAGRGKQELCALAQDVDTRLAALGFPSETKNFAAHLTIGRVRSNRNRADLAEILRQISGDRLGEMSVETFRLVKSELSPQGPKYTDLEVFHLLTR